MLLHDDGCCLQPLVLCALHPASHSLLHEYAGRTQLICSQLLQVGHLARSEEDLGLTKLVLVWILKKRVM